MTYHHAVIDCSKGGHTTLVPLTAEEVAEVEARVAADPGERPDPITADAQLAALLAAKGVITTDEAADITGHPKERLVAEVEAWAAAEEITAKR